MAPAVSRQAAARRDQAARHGQYLLRAARGTALQIGIRALELLRNNGIEQVHSRKLRSFAEPAFR
jgi:hypothetical protein